MSKHVNQVDSMHFRDQRVNLFHNEYGRVFKHGYSACKLVFEPLSSLLECSLFNPFKPGVP